MPVMFWWYILGKWTPSLKPHFFIYELKNFRAYLLGLPEPSWLLLQSILSLSHNLSVLMNILSEEMPVLYPHLPCLSMGPLVPSKEKKGTSNSVWALNFLHLRVNSITQMATHPSNSHVGETLVSVWGQPELLSEHEFYDHLVWTMVWHLVTKKLSTLMSLIFFSAAFQ